MKYEIVTLTIGDRDEIHYLVPRLTGKRVFRELVIEAEPDALPLDGDMREESVIPASASTMTRAKRIEGASWNEYHGTVTTRYLFGFQCFLYWIELGMRSYFIFP
ncbi:MAG: hypothetical protein V4681_00165 [Patescibacteria group bacterium]